MLPLSDGVVHSEILVQSTVEIATNHVANCVASTARSSTVLAMTCMHGGLPQFDQPAKVQFHGVSFDTTH